MTEASVIKPEARFMRQVPAPALSHPGPDFQVSLLEEALNPSPRSPLNPGLRDNLLRLTDAETDPAAALAMIFTSHPVLVQTADKAIAKAPLQIIHFHRASAT